MPRIIIIGVAKIGDDSGIPKLAYDKDQVAGNQAAAAFKVAVYNQ